MLKKLSLVLTLALMMCLLAACDSSGGDGVNSCKNCGRKGSVSYMGYCSSCQKSFNNWQKKNGY